MKDTARMVDSDAGTARSRLLAKGIATSVVARACVAATPLLLIPLTFEYLGESRFGVWMTVTALTSMFLWADLGLGNGLLTEVSRCLRRKDNEGARRAVATSYAILTGLGVLAAAAVTAAASALPWNAVVNNDNSYATSISTVCLAAFLLNVPAALVHRLLFAVQRVSTSNLLLMLGSLLSLIAAAVGRLLEVDPVFLIFGVVAAPVLTNAAASVFFFFRMHGELRPRLSDVGRGGNNVLATGGKFLVLSVLTAISLNSDNLIVAHVRSSAAVAEFSVVSRVFTALGLLITVVTLPLWPAAADALERSDLAWVGKATRKMSSCLLLAVMAAGLLIIVVRKPLFASLVGSPAAADLTLMVGFAVSWTAVAVVSPLFMVQNSVGVLRPQLLAWAAFLPVSVTLKILTTANFGVQLIPWVTFLCYVAIVVPGAVSGYSKAKGRASGEASASHSGAAE